MESLLASFDESSALLQAQYDRARSMLSSSDFDGASDAFRALHNSFVAHTDAASRALSAAQHPDERAACDAAAEASALAQELRFLRDCTHGSGPLFAAPARASPAAFASFASRAGEAAAHCAALRAALRGLLARPAALSAAAPPAALSACGAAGAAQWAAREEQLRARWRALLGEAERLGAGAGPGPGPGATRDGPGAGRDRIGERAEWAAGLAALLDGVVAMGRRAAKHIEAGAAERDRRARGAADVAAQQRRLVVWCRQQRVNLDALSDPDHVQEYCAALLEHYRLMSRNCKVLLDAADPLVADAAVQDVLLEASEVWLHLQAVVLERLRDTLFEVNAEVPLEQHVVEHSTYAARAAAFVAQLPNALAQDRSTPFGREVEELRQVLSGESSEMERKLGEFAERMTALREAYGCFRTAGLARVTYLSTPADVLGEAARRREEFETCVEDLRAWADERGRSDAWRDIREKVRDVQELLKKEVAMEGCAVNNTDKFSEETILDSKEEEFN